MSTPAPSFRRGAAAVQAASTSGGDFPSFQRTEYFSIKSGDKAVVRFLTDYDSVADPNGELVGGWLGVKQHQNIKTKPQPADYKGTSWPQRMAAPCRRDPIFASVYSDCYICDVIKPADPMVKAPSQRLYALAVVREPVMVDGKQTYRDATRTVTRKSDGGEVSTEEKRIVVVNMGKKNFFDPLSAYANRYGTILDRDYEITRHGDQLDTTYLIIPEDQQQATKADGTVEVYDLREDEFMANYFPEAIEVGYAKASDLHLEPVITDKTTDDFYGRFFDPTWNNPSAPASAPVVAPVAEAAPVQPVVQQPAVDTSTNDIQALIAKLGDADLSR
jgi:hypothetical protein